MQLANSSFIVTGGSSGLGAGCVKRFAEAGANIVSLDLNVEAGHALADQYDNVHFMRADVTSEADITAAITYAETTYGALHGAINCAGIVIGRKVSSSRGPHDLESFSKIMMVNVVGTFNVIRLVTTAIRAQEAGAKGEKGVFITTSSVAAFEGQIGQPAYAASKAAIAGMTLPIARELARYGIRVVSIAPGIFDTPMLGGMPENVRESLAQQVPFPSRFGSADEYAALAQHIVENEMLNGEVIRLDGAIRMAPM